MTPVPASASGSHPPWSNRPRTAYPAPAPTPPEDAADRGDERGAVADPDGFLRDHRGDARVLGQECVLHGEGADLGRVAAAGQQATADGETSVVGHHPQVGQEAVADRAQGRPRLRQGGDEHHRDQQGMDHAHRGGRGEQADAVPEQVADHPDALPDPGRRLIGPLHEQREVGVVEGDQLDLGDVLQQLALDQPLDPGRERRRDGTDGELESCARRQCRHDEGDGRQGRHHPFRGRTVREQPGEHVGRGEQSERGRDTRQQMHDPGQQRPSRRGPPRPPGQRHRGPRHRPGDGEDPGLGGHLHRPRPLRDRQVLDPDQRPRRPFRHGRQCAGTP